ncbi:NADH-quinone oxidoreductase subunit NuoE [Ruegeria sp. SCSIO 43209]|uniref:NADH-quinone oxidoreductase subunit NuoE n=1 Tax=Ruegeria sp. SCSIO 43209 TaxID=2793010 RepID=UPI001CA9F220|nr:NADH-quinone oxidoreductase subunit NuoE [Ruegeria sp. SCSIO 43209]UAB89767.1 NADH-quinone oxidoreductase subunit NuoE [Ruegeria sp. SCSIO 43209]
MLRRLHAEQPESFAFTAANQKWAEAQITKYPEGRQASAVIPLLWRAQEQEGWLSRPAIESVADMLGMAYIRVLEVASFYFMFQLQPVGSVAHIQVCGTTSCMICGAEDLIVVCKEKIAAKPHELSADGKLSWEEVECLGSCTNAPMAQIGKDYYEDLTTESFGKILDDLVAGKVPTPGPQNGRYAAEPLKGLTSLTEYDSGRTQYNASVQLASDLGDTVKRIDGTEVPILTPWLGKDGKAAATKAAPKPPKAPASAKPAVKQAAEAKAAKEDQPETLSSARDGKPDDLKMLKGVGPKLEETLNELGFYHYDQIAAWTPEQVAWVDARLKFKGRIERDGWIEQAAKLATGIETDFAKRAKEDGTYED